MEKTILFISSMDTKKEEIGLAAKIARESGCHTLVLDTSTKTILPNAGDISPLEVLGHSGITWEEFEQMGKGLRIETMAKAVIPFVKKLWQEGKFDGVMSIGGGQNSKMAADAMKELPYGIPKLIVSTLASGKRTFDMYMGNRDIVVMHSVIDIAGVNSITKMIINNAVAAMVGMVNHSVGLVKEKEKKCVAATMLGITTKGATAVMSAMEELGCETIGFHANGVGGGSMEKLVDEDYFDLILDMNLHEITCEFFGGFCSGAYQRLYMASEKGVPQIVVPGAIDVLDYGVTLENRKSVLECVKDRQYYFHNAGIIHSKIKKDEAEKLGLVVAERLNRASGPLKVILPLGGFCEAGAEGKELCNKEVDQMLITSIEKFLKPTVDVIEVDANINDQEFSDVVIEEARKMLKL